MSGQTSDILQVYFPHCAENFVKVMLKRQAKILKKERETNVAASVLPVFPCVSPCLT